MEHKNIYVVVLVQSGIPTDAEAYFDEETALSRAEVIREETDLNDDAVGVFEVEIGSKS